MKPKWKQFEETIFFILKQLSPNAKVRYDYKVKGSITGIERQVDIAIFNSIGPVDLFIAVECKDYSRPVDVPKLEAFISMIDDISADKGVMVSSSGFTSTSKTYASNKGITLNELNNKQVNDVLYIRKAVLVKEMSSFSFSIEKFPIDILKLPNFNLHDILLISKEDEKITDVNKFIYKEWNSGRLPGEIGSHRVKTDVDFYYMMRRNETRLVVEYTVTGNYYVKSFRVVELEEYSDSISNEVIVRNTLTEEFFDKDPTIDDSYIEIDKYNLLSSELDKLVETRLKFNISVISTSDNL